MAYNSSSFVFIITPPEPSQCILSYNITPTDRSGTALPDITVEVASGDIKAFIAGGFDPCNNAYNFTVVAITLAGSGERSAVINPVQIG